MKTLGTVLFLILGSHGAWAGGHSISGQIINRNGKPVDQAIVSLKPGNVEMMTDREGRFVIDYLRDEEGLRLKLTKRTTYDLEVFKVGYHIETRQFFYKRGEVSIETIRLTEDTIQVHDDDANLSESLGNKPTHSAGANYEGQ